MVAYSCAKVGVDARTRHIAASRYRGNAIQPGMVTTDNAWAMAESLPLDQILSRTPAPRLGKPEDSGALALFLLSDAVAFMNGQILSYDGGIHAVLNDVGAA